MEEISYNRFINIFKLEKIPLKKNFFYVFFKLSNKYNLKKEEFIELIKIYNKLNKEELERIISLSRKYNINILNIFKSKIYKKSKEKNIDELVNLSKKHNVDINDILTISTIGKFSEMPDLLNSFEKYNRDKKIFKIYTFFGNYEFLKKILEISNKNKYYFYNVFLLYKKIKDFDECSYVVEIIKKNNMDIEEVLDSNVNLVYIADYYNKNLKDVNNLYSLIKDKDIVNGFFFMEKEFGMDYRKILDLYNEFFEEYNKEDCFSFFQMIKFSKKYNVDLVFVKKFFNKFDYNFDFIEFLIDKKDKYKITIEDCINLANLLIKENILRHKYVKIEESLLEGKLKEINRR